MFAVRPRPGSIAVFPPWLTHFVERTRGGEARIALSFNLLGRWKALAHRSALPIGGGGDDAFEQEESSNCALWASWGECEANPKYMIERCSEVCD